MAADLVEYFERHRRICRDRSLNDDELACYEEEGSRGRSGHLHGRLGFGEDAYLSVHEVVTVEDGEVRREEYGYFFIFGGIEIWGCELDPSHDPPLHCHGRGHARYAADEPMSFAEAVELAWETVTRAAADGLDDLDSIADRLS